jgi:hypothetical protein
VTYIISASDSSAARADELFPCKNSVMSEKRDRCAQFRMPRAESYTYRLIACRQVARDVKGYYCTNYQLIAWCTGRYQFGKSTTTSVRRDTWSNSDSNSGYWLQTTMP